MTSKSERLLPDGTIDIEEIGLRSHNLAFLFERPAIATLVDISTSA
jgi:hypothetical protein